ncbi:hypothetical protein AB00_5306 [Raoultella ornithinolytica 2-156-04_S1_C1]|nr:hypothetical protein AB00_5306 [Raoultella ornithinolytica 2-156-04_S1_C1]
MFFIVYQFPAAFSLRFFKKRAHYQTKFTVLIESDSIPKP